MSLIVNTYVTSDLQTLRDTRAINGYILRNNDVEKSIPTANYHWEKSYFILAPANIIYSKLKTLKVRITARRFIMIKPSTGFI